VAGYAPPPGQRTPHATAYEMSPPVYHECDGRRPVRAPATRSVSQCLLPAVLGVVLLARPVLE